MLDAGYFPAMPLRKIRGVDLTDQQYDDYARISGRLAKMQLNTFVGSPGFGTLPASVRHEQIQKIVTGSRETAAAMIMMRSPDIITKAMDAKTAKLRGEPVH
jgi:hypothetical protein